jgi:hypothetical protein
MPLQSVVLEGRALAWEEVLAAVEKRAAAAVSEGEDSLGRLPIVSKSSQIV